MMNSLKKIVLVGCVAGVSFSGLVGGAIADETPLRKSVVPASVTSADPSVRQAYETWVSTVGAANCNPVPVLALYDKDAILLATLSSTVRENSKNQLRPYFEKFTCLPNLKGTTNQILTRSFGDTAINSGIYTFTYTGTDGKTVSVPARFSFTYRKVNGKWLIVDHHSSVVPKDIVVVEKKN
ncbi:hypothetical protein TUMEXPCC7403_15945 [Tumidithrix helvetica PCC 7403]|uniref:SgcJ/EcaC family oxidoreductase n=1 Tax=Tumidithrix helvetica TaxID=3457545 RepID=UPI003CB2BB14